MSSQPLIQKPQKVGLTIPKTALFLVGEIAGTGILTLPRAIEDSGLTGNFILLILFVLSTYTGTLLGKSWTIARYLYDDCKGNVPDPYPLLGEKTYGKFGRYVVSFSMNCFMFGTSIVFLLLMSGNVQIVAGKLGADISICYWLIVLTACLVPLTWFGTPKDFWPIAIGASIASFLACVLMIILMAMDYSSRTESIRHSNIEIQDFAMAIGTMQFTLTGHPIFPTLQTDMKRPSDFKWAAVLGYFLVFCLYMPVASTGYAIYGDKLEPNILDTVTQGTISDFVLILITIHIMLAFCIVLNPVNQEFEKWINIPQRPKQKSDITIDFLVVLYLIYWWTVSVVMATAETRNSNLSTSNLENTLNILRHVLSFTWKRCVSRAFIACAALFIAETIPRFDAILSLIGGSVVIIMGYVCPILFYMKICYLLHQTETKTKNHYESTDQMLLETSDNEKYLPLWLKVMNYEIVIVGVVIGIAASVSAVISIVSPNSFSLPCYVNITSVEA